MTNKKSKIKDFLNNNKFILAVVVGLLVVGGSVMAAGGLILNISNVENMNVAGGSSEQGMLGSAEMPDCANNGHLGGCPSTYGNLYSEGAVEIDGILYTDGGIVNAGTLTQTGNANVAGELTYLESYTEVNNTATTTATTTLTAAMSGTTFYFSSVSTTEFLLPATSTSAGTIYRFVVDGALDTNCTIKTNGLNNIIEGSMIVAGAVVDCDAEDTITFVADGENIGDFIELRSDGEYWTIGASGALTSSKMTCSTST